MKIVGQVASFYMSERGAVRGRLGHPVAARGLPGRAGQLHRDGGPPPGRRGRAAGLLPAAGSPRAHPVRRRGGPGGALGPDPRHRRRGAGFGLRGPLVPARHGPVPDRHAAEQGLRPRPHRPGGRLEPGRRPEAGGTGLRPHPGRRRRGRAGQDAHLPAAVPGVRETALRAAVRGLQEGQPGPEDRHPHLRLHRADPGRPGGNRGGHPQSRAAAGHGPRAPEEALRQST